MKYLTDQKIQARKEHHESFACSCESRALRKRINRGGATQYVYQCQRCGEVALQAVKRAVAFELCGGQEPPPLDTSLNETWRRTKAEAGDCIETNVATAFWSGYTQYLATPGWAERRRLVFQRAGGLCEGCRTVPPTEVHHLTYAHVGEEFLFELAAVCHECHLRLHAKTATGG